MTVTAIPQNAQPAEGGADSPVPPKSGRRKLLLVLVAVLVVAGGAYWFVLRPGPASDAPKPGDVVKLDAIQVNLADAHYLRIGLALQLVAGVKDAEGSKALDAAIEEFSGKDMAQVNDPAQRALLKKQLVEELDHRYDGDVMGVYFTEFVTQ